MIKQPMAALPSYIKAYLFLTAKVGVNDISNALQMHYK